ncbi:MULTISPECIES: hypothetical protein [unclassified Streptomyces]|uniref:hypothetical protein n=1 Tax=unclassified Streptomyces TaxID=2593676 RepID=UPI000374280C|nr:MULTISPECIES: hypothetical protein [unclassified Streptomyces]MYT27364.1 hypothetical protein [Streptomyces sp. SID8354]
MTSDELRPGPREQLAVVNAAPDLSRSASVRERVVSLATLAVLYAGLVTAMECNLPRIAGVGVYLAALVLLLTWNGHHDDAARRRPHTRLEKAARFGGVVLLSIPATNLIFGGGPDTLIGHLLTAAIPTVCAAVYFVLRWKR